LQTVCGFFYRGKTPENAEFAIAGAVLGERENRSGESDKAKGRWQGSERGFFSLPQPPPPRFVNLPRPIFTRVQDGASDGEFSGFFRDKKPTKRLQAGY